MDNSETHPLLGTKHKTKTDKHTHTHKTNKMSNMDSTKIQGVKPGARETKTVPVSCKTPAVLFIVKSSKSLVDHTGKTTSV